MAAETSYYHYDGLGSTVALTDSSQNVTDTYTYNAFGEQVASSGTTVNPFRFVGERGYYYDSDTGDYYVRARVYRAALIRWLSEDPIAFAAGDVNMYRYVRSNPSNWIDPSGQKDCCCCCVDSLGLQNLKQIDIPNKTMGHSFDVAIGLSYVLWPGGSADCTLLWLEKTNVPYVRGMRKDRWELMLDILPNSAVFENWKTRTKPCPGSEKFSLTDTPLINNIPPPVTMNRTLEIQVIVSSAENCLCQNASLTIEITQNVSSN